MRRLSREVAPSFGTDAGLVRLGSSMTAKQPLIACALLIGAIAGCAAEDTRTQEQPMNGADTQSAAPITPSSR